ncbi:MULTISPECIES: glutamate cyclase domain-containing protein [unclassified Duganella]|uniref:glutamate cyclase domain-containing protein n=1 Tax=unclassified Duganella TaxID=2636909 RepID=UPI000E346B0E|nr:MULTISPECIES: glutamate cyclase domain-containing protein [unclassified Duganella]RFP09331.1 DUF4392 domain-containing protein [Duganella sp. BJB475]RFP25367.1 DUF4392 domain-containing protein [Duganella sp. BJB476]
MKTRISGPSQHAVSDLAPQEAAQQAPARPAASRTRSATSAHAELGNVSKRQKTGGASGSQLRAALPGATASRPATAHKPAGPATSAIDKLMASYDMRNLSKFFQPGGVERSAEALLQPHITKVMLLTGFSVDKGLPETDGPPGTATLGHALQQLGKTVTYVTDSTNLPLMKAAVKALNPDAAQYTKFETFDVAHGAGARGHADAMLDKHQPDAVVAIELPARADDGVRRNMRGLDINPFNPPLDEIVLAANDRKGITTVGVGDGGNEAGMAWLGEIPKAMNGLQMASSVPVQHPVTSWNSNLGGLAIAADLAGKTGKLEILPSHAQQADLIHATLNAGAVDGVTRGKVAGEAVVSAAGVTNRTGVDGFEPEVHQAMLSMLKNIVQSVYAGQVPRGIVATSTPHDGRPFLIGAFDSSNGGLVAAKNLAGFIQMRSPHTARFVVVTDHGNAPYGTKTPDQLVTLVGHGLQTTQHIGVDIIAMACNTACTAFPAAKAGLKTPVLDLIDVTSSKIVELGGAKPAMFSTPATARDTRYPGEVKAKSNGALQLTPIGAEKWAPLINNLDHASDKPEVKTAVREAVHEYVNQVPHDATSVWLCCTHYPALKPQIEDAMRETGRGHIPVVDPMEHQAMAIIGMLNEKGPAIDRSSRRRDLAPVVVTTGFTVGNVDHQVPKSAKGMLGLDKAPQVIYTKFGRDFKMSVAQKQVSEQLFEQTAAAPRRSERLQSAAHA